MTSGENRGPSQSQREKPWRRCHRGLSRSAEWVTGCRRATASPWTTDAYAALRGPLATQPKTVGCLSAKARQQHEGTAVWIPFDKHHCLEFSPWENEWLLRGQWAAPTDTAGRNPPRLFHGYVGWIYGSQCRKHRKCWWRRKLAREDEGLWVLVAGVTQCLGFICSKNELKGEHAAVSTQQPEISWAELGVLQQSGGLRLHMPGQVAVISSKSLVCLVWSRDLEHKRSRARGVSGLPSMHV